MASSLTGHLSRAEFTSRVACTRRRYRYSKTAVGSQLVAQVSQLDRHIFDRLITVLRIFCQAASHNSLQMIRRVGAEVGDRSHRLADDLVKRVNHIFSGKGFVSGYRLVQDANEGKKVLALIDFVGL